MNRLISIDPGLRHVGWALFEAGKLVKAGLAVNPTRHERGGAAWRSMADAVVLALPDIAVDPADTHLVLECPQVYAAGKQKGDPADLIELAGVDGAIIGALSGVAGRVVTYLPREWKGQTPKDIHNARIEKMLSLTETANIGTVAASLRHNIIDAIGIGLFHAKLLGIRR